MSTIAFGADERNALTDHIAAALRARGHRVELFGPPGGASHTWPDVGRQVGQAVASGQADQGIVCCWTGTGVSIAANKVPGVRAALCTDAETARGARRWNDANVLCLSLRLTSEAVADEILDAWFAPAEITPDDRAEIARLEG